MVERDLSSLDQLAALCEASENGFRVAAETVRNRGLKALLKSYARQRASMADELRGEIERLGGQPKRRPGALAALHRGWIDLRGVMIIGDSNTEEMVLAEAARGERVAVQRFERTQVESLPEPSQRMLQRMRAQVKAVAEEVDQLRGRDDERLIVRLLDGREDADKAISALHAAGFASDAIETMPGGELIEPGAAQVRRGVFAETLAAGALLGGGVGLLIGLCAGLATALMPGIGQVVPSSPLLVLLIWTVAGGIVGALAGAVMTSLLARGIHEQDSFWSEDLVRHGDTMILVHAEPNRARQAADILAQINHASRAQRLPQTVGAGSSG